MVVSRKMDLCLLLIPTHMQIWLKNIGWPALDGLVEQAHILWLRIVLRRY